jgi:hypothetical protein
MFDALLSGRRVAANVLNKSSLSLKKPLLLFKQSRPLLAVNQYE